MRTVDVVERQLMGSVNKCHINIKNQDRAKKNETKLIEIQIYIYFL